MRASITHIETKNPKIVAIIDNDDGAMTITNDAEGVVKFLFDNALLKNGQRLIYRDTEGVWDELNHKEGKFVGFAFIGAHTIEQAITATATP